MKEILKKKAKVFAVACLSILAVGSIIFIACQDDDEVRYSDDKNKYLVVPSINPYKYVGIEHNIELENIISHINMDRPFYRAMYEYDIIYYNLDTNMTTYNTYKEYMNNVLDRVFDYLEDSTAFDNYISDPEIHLYLNKLRNIFTDILDEANLLSVDTFSQKIRNLEMEFITTHDTNDLTESQQKLLASFAIAEYSYIYWTDAVYNPNSPWFPLWQDVITFLSSNSTKKELKAAQKLLKALQNVAAVVCGAAADAITYVVTAAVPNDYSGSNGVAIPIGNKTAEKKAAEMSAVVKENIKGDD
ncbi:MAG: hypothetical protein J6P44_05195 [Bacteroidales bacterium]|nr:hypothetical protein [Bacteroidales bacterium]